MDDKHIVAQARRGELSAFEELVTRYEKRVYAPHFGHQGIIRYSFQMKIGSGGSFFRFIHSQPSTV